MQSYEKDTLREMAGDIKKPDLPSVDEALRLCEFDWDRSLTEPTPVYLMGGVPICTRGNIMTITASPKLGKSALGAAMIASTMVEGLDADTLYAKSDNPDERAVIHFDTEQDARRHEALVRGVVQRAKRTRPPKWFHSYRVKGGDPAALQKRLERALVINSERHRGVHSVILDGVADFIVDPNDPDECFPFITLLENLAVRYDTVVVCILHLNPSSSFGSGTKSRGHLGSQLERKAETEIRLKRDSDGAVSCWTYLARGAPIAQDHALRFRWSDQHGCHTSAGSIKEEKEVRRLAELYKEAQAVWGADQALPYTEVVRRIANHRGISTKAAQRRHAILCDPGIILKGDDRCWHIIQLQPEKIQQQ